MKKFLLLLVMLPMIGFGQNINESLKMISNEMNKNCPMVIDEYTTLLNTYGGNGQVIYNLQLDNYIFTLYEWSKSEWLYNQTIVMTNSFCTDPSFRIFIENNVDVTWKYSDLEGNYIGKVKLNAKDCK